MSVLINVTLSQSYLGTGRYASNIVLLLPGIRHYKLYRKTAQIVMDGIVNRNKLNDLLSILINRDDICLYLFSVLKITKDIKCTAINLNLLLT